MARAEAASGAGLSEKRTPGLPVTLLDKARFPFDSGRRTPAGLPTCHGVRHGAKPPTDSWALDLLASGLR